MLKDTRSQPKAPEEESDEPPIIAGEARYTSKKSPAGLGEFIGKQRQSELNKAELQRKQIF
jgi:hypothetical protein